MMKTECKKEKESCDWREDKGGAGSIKVLLDEWVPRGERDGLEGGKGLEKKKDQSEE